MKAFLCLASFLLYISTAHTYSIPIYRHTGTPSHEEYFSQKRQMPRNKPQIKGNILKLSVR